jgi:hypothetical protein
MRGISCLAEDLFASQEEFCSMELFISLFTYLLLLFNKSAGSAVGLVDTGAILA